MILQEKAFSNRIFSTQMLGSMINLKPLVQINHETGVVEPAARARTRKKAIDMLIQKFFEQLDTEKPLHVAVLHGNAQKDAEQLAERIQQDYSPKELRINTGPNALALGGYSE